MELEIAVRNGTTSGGNATRQRRHYASLDPTSMGVDVQVGPVMNLGSPDFDNNRSVSQSFNDTKAISQHLFNTQCNRTIERLAPCLVYTRT